MERNFLRRLEAMPSVDIINESLLMSTIFSFVKKVMESRRLKAYKNTPQKYTAKKQT